MITDKKVNDQLFINYLFPLIIFIIIILFFLIIMKVQ